MSQGVFMHEEGPGLPSWFRKRTISVFNIGVGARSEPRDYLTTSVNVKNALHNKKERERRGSMARCSRIAEGKYLWVYVTTQYPAY